MSDALRKVLLGAVIGALLVGFAWHVMGERARRTPNFAGGPAAAATGAPVTTPGKPASGGGAGPGGQPVAVVAAPATLTRLGVEIEALGTARANESIDVTAKVSNQVTAVRFEEGQQVARGTVLVELDSEQARADLAVAAAALKESTSQYKRSMELYDTKVLSDAQIEQIEATFRSNEARVAAARARLNDTFVRAPFAGRVGLRRISVGSLVSPGDVITTLDDIRTIKLDFTVPETVVAAMQPGLEIKATSVAYPEREFLGRVASVDSRVDPSTRAVTVRALLPNKEALLKPGMFLTVRLAQGERDMLMVPEETLVPEQGNVFVYVVRDDKAEKREIQTGQRRVGSVQVLDGLQAGEMVVTEGTQKLRDGAAVRLVESGAAGKSGAAPPTRAAAK
jgi:membrane fusion protein (multidrug efflux system)